MYLPLACVILLIVGCVFRWTATSRAIPVFVLILVALATISFFRCQMWRNEVVFWSDSASKAVHSPRPLSELGRALARAGQYDQAVDAIERALKIHERPTAKLDLALKAENELALRLAKLYALTGKQARIPRLLQKWFDGDEYFHQYLDAGLLFADGGDHKQAERWFRQAAEATKNRREKAFVLVEHGYSMLSAGSAVEGRSLLESAVSLDEKNWKAHNNLGIAIMTTDQDTDLAGKHFAKAVELSGNNPEAVANLNRILMIKRSQ